jgi:ferredoxin
VAVRIEVFRDKCEGHGLCEQAAPAVYQLDDDGELVVLHEESVPQDLERQAQTGARSCPVAALLVH